MGVCAWIGTSPQGKIKKLTLENDNVAYVESVFYAKTCCRWAKNGQKMHHVTSILPFFCFIQLWSHIFVSKNGPVAYVGNCFSCCKMAKNASFWVDFFMYCVWLCEYIFKINLPKMEIYHETTAILTSKTWKCIEQCFLSDISDLGTWNNITFPLQFPLQNYRGPYYPVSTFAILYRTLAIGVSVSNSIKIPCWKQMLKTWSKSNWSIQVSCQLTNRQNPRQ